MTHILHRSIHAKLPVAVAGRGVELFDADGKGYIDASGGAAVYCLGHGHPDEQLGDAPDHGHQAEQHQSASRHGAIIADSPEHRDVPDNVIVEIVDEVFLPLVRSRDSTIPPPPPRHPAVPSVGR